MTLNKYVSVIRQKETRNNPKAKQSVLAGQNFACLIKLATSHDGCMQMIRELVPPDQIQSTLVKVLLLRIQNTIMRMEHLCERDTCHKLVQSKPWAKLKDRVQTGVLIIATYLVCGDCAVALGVCDATAINPAEMSDNLAHRLHNTGRRFELAPSCTAYWSRC